MLPTRSATGKRKRETPLKAEPESSCKTSIKNTKAKSKAPSGPLPAHFASLVTTHRALVTVGTFLSARNPAPPTLSTLAPAVSAHTKRQLTVDELTQIKALAPQSVSIDYADAVPERSSSGGKDGRDKEFILPALDGSAKSEELVFEFTDGHLLKAGDATKLRTQKITQAQMMKAIEQRTRKFRSVVDSFLEKCTASGLDPVEKLRADAEQYVPRHVSLVEAPTEIPSSSERKSVPEIVDEIKSLPWYKGQIVEDGYRVIDAQEAAYGNLNFALSQQLVDALYSARGITQFYSHQVEAINNLYDGKHVIVSTPTSSGKSLIYQIPVLHELEKDRRTRAMYIFPTKALAQDQKRGLKDMLGLMPSLADVLVETFDGDTPIADRRFIRDEARVIFTNPDMLHISILPNETGWRNFLQNLKFVVVDELHVYNGIFGAHVALIMRRLRRICAAVGNRHIRFISCSATVANPKEHMATIFGVSDVSLTSISGSPAGRKSFICWNTPFKDPTAPASGRGDLVAEAAHLFCALILRGARTIAFCRVRKLCEALLAAVRAELTAQSRASVAPRVMSYRGGYTPQDRRAIEKDMFAGRLVGIVATSALELGVDIGALDAVVTVGFPYSIANLRQQSGRAGRRNRDSLSVLVGGSYPADQHFMRNPNEIFDRPNAALQVDLENVLVLEGHVQCAAFEIPINLEADVEFFGPQLAELARERLRSDADGLYYCSARFLPRPSDFVSIRVSEEDHIAIIDTTNGRNEVIEQLEVSRAYFTIYEGAIFLHQGTTYLVSELSLDRMLATVERVRVDYTTRQRDFTDVDAMETHATRAIPGSTERAFFGAVRITQVVFGFFKVDKRGTILDAVEVHNPPIIRHTKGLWLDVPRFALDILASRRLNAAAAIHAAEHALLSLLPVVAIAAPGDVRTECKAPEKELAKRETARKRPARLTLYDAGCGGSGVCRKAFEFVDVLLRQALARVEACKCGQGCLECCCDERCGEGNVVVSKSGAGVVLKALLGVAIDVDALPWGEDEAFPAGVETVVPAGAVPVRSEETT